MSGSSGTILDCGCENCPDGVPKQFKVVLSGVTNGSWSCCGDNNSVEFILDRFGICIWGPVSLPCWGDLTLLLQILARGGENILQVYIAPGTVKWEIAVTESGCMGTFVLPNVESSSPFCTAGGSTATVTGIPFDLTTGDQTFWACMPSMQGSDNSTGKPCPAFPPLALGSSPPTSSSEPVMFPYI